MVISNRQIVNTNEVTLPPVDQLPAQASPGIDTAGFKEMVARFPGKCSITGESIARGDTIKYDHLTKRVILVKHKARLVNRYEMTDYYIAKYGSRAPA